MHLHHRWVGLCWAIAFATLQVTNAGQHVLTFEQGFAAATVLAEVRSLSIVFASERHMLSPLL